jgi:serine kinase of HPr protein (carbohydrate metabolism regulator)
MVLLGNEYTPFAKVLQFASELPVKVLKEVLHTSRLRENVKKYLQSLIADGQDLRPAKKKKGI